MSGSFRIELLGAHHDRSAFNSESAALDRYIREQASQDMKRLVSSCFVLVERSSGVVAGYYTLAATSIPAEDIASDVLKKLPRYPILPAALVGRLAVDTRFRRQGLGGTLIADAALRILAGDLKAFAIIVDAKDDKAAAFYRSQGFQHLASRPKSMFLPLATFREAAKPA